MRSKFIGLLAVVGFEIGCSGVSRGAIALPAYDRGRWTYNKDLLGSNEEPYGMIPQALLEDHTMSSEARSCAIAYNEALNAMRNCDKTNVVFRALEVGAAGMAVVATSIASQVNSDDAKRRWIMTSLVSSALFTGFTTFDLWNNCRDRTFAQQALAADRLSRLQKAGHFVECANRIGTFQIQLAEAQRALETILSATASDKELLTGEINPFAIQSLALRLDAMQRVPTLSAHEKRATANAAIKLKELAKRIPTLCHAAAPPAAAPPAAAPPAAAPPAAAPPAAAPPAAAPPPVSGRLPLTYYDLAHAELSGCFNPRPTPYGADRFDSGLNSR